MAITLKKSGGISSNRQFRNQAGMLSVAISKAVGARTGVQRGKYTTMITAHIASKEIPVSLANRIGDSIKRCQKSARVIA